MTELFNAIVSLISPQAQMSRKRRTKIEVKTDKFSLKFDSLEE